MTSDRARAVLLGTVLLAAWTLITACAGTVVPPSAAAPGIPVSTVAPVPPDPDVPRAPGPVPRTGEPGLWLAWHLRDTATGRTAGSANAATERTNAESAIKVWIAADLSRVAYEQRRPLTAAERDLVRRAVRGSDDAAAERLYRRLGGDVVLSDLRRTCGVDVRTSRRGYWSYAQITAVDAVAMLTCVLRLAPGWPGGAELIGDLRAVDADGRAGVETVVPPGTTVAQKNGWTYHSATGWNVNCVLAWDRYVLSVLTRFPGGRSEQYGWGVCRDVARDVLPLP